MPYFAGPVADERDALLTERETLDGVLGYYAETAELTRQIAGAPANCWMPTKPARRVCDPAWNPG